MRRTCIRSYEHTINEMGIWYPYIETLIVHRRLSFLKKLPQWHTAERWSLTRGVPVYANPTSNIQVINIMFLRLSAHKSNQIMYWFPLPFIKHGSKLGTHDLFSCKGYTDIRKLSKQSTTTRISVSFKHSAVYMFDWWVSFPEQMLLYGSDTQNPVCRNWSPRGRSDIDRTRLLITSSQAYGPK